MTLSAGTHLGPYEILSPLGAGGMGEVYRARDARLAREVAIKVLPESLAADAERLKRFEKEARSASALNHPNIVTVYDIGLTEGTSFIAMELVSGETLRGLLAGAVLTNRKLLSIAVQVAEGLAKAHESGIVHRDLKPENVMVTRDGLVKILDFGLAKLISPMSGSDEGSNLPTMTGTTPGVVVGTVGYMSPEQASGAAVDYRSDQFSFGSILYELATGKPAFQRKTAIDTLAAILNEEPAAIATSAPQTPAPLRWIVERCLAKDPADRYVATRDLARELSSVRDHLSEASSAELAIPPPRPRVPMSAWLAVVLTTLGLAFTIGRRSTPTPAPPSFHRLTFRRGQVSTARFTPDGQTVVYGAAWDRDEVRLFTTRVLSPESAPLGEPGAELLAISTASELAILPTSTQAGYSRRGTLARVPLAGGAPREVLEGVEWADWSPDGKTLASIRTLDGRPRLEFPIGKVLVEAASGYFSHARVSPKGDRVAFLEHPLFGDDKGSVAVVDLLGKKTTLSSGWSSENGLVWTPDGEEVWFTGSRPGMEEHEIRAVSLAGKERLVYRAPLGMILQDLSPDRRVLMTKGNWRLGVRGKGAGETVERDLTWFDQTLVTDVSEDGQTILIHDQGAGGGTNGSVGVRRLDGSPPVRLGDGAAWQLSSDGKQALVGLESQHPSQLTLMPTGPGEPRTVTHDAIDHQQAQFLPDGKRILFNGTEPGHKVRPYVQSLEGGPPRPVAPEGMVANWKGISPDAKYVLASDSANRLFLYPIGDGEPRSVSNLFRDPKEEFVRWTADPRYVFVCRCGETPMKVYRMEIATGRKTPWSEIHPVEESRGLVLNSAGTSYAYTYLVSLNDLYLVEGLR